MKRIIIALFLMTIGAAFTTSALAGEWGLVIHGASMHFSQREYGSWNQANDGFGVRYAVDQDVAFQAGHYRNSMSLGNYNAFSNYVIADYTPWRGRPFSVGMFAGLASGYDDIMTMRDTRGDRTYVTQEKPLVPVGGLVIRADLNRVFSVTTRIAPNLMAVEGGVRF